MDSVHGQGTTAQIRLPLTLAIVNGLLVEISDGPYAIPLDRIERTLRLAEHPVQSVAGEQLLVLDEGVLPLLDASRVFGRAPRPHDFAVIVRSREQRMALAVDELSASASSSPARCPGRLRRRARVGRCRPARRPHRADRRLRRALPSRHAAHPHHSQRRPWRHGIRRPRRLTGSELPVTISLNDSQLDALRELANIASAKCRRRALPAACPRGRYLGSARARVSRSPTRGQPAGTRSRR